MLDNNEVRKRILDIFVEVSGVEADDISDDSEIVEELGLDSLDNVELVMSLENEFDLAISDDEAEKLVTFGDVVTYILDNA